MSKSYYNELLKKANSEVVDDRILAACCLDEEDRASLLTDSDELVRAAAKYRTDNGPIGVRQFQKILRGEILKKEKKEWPKSSLFVGNIPIGYATHFQVSDAGGLNRNFIELNNIILERISNIEVGGCFYLGNDLVIDHLERTSVWSRLCFAISFVLFGKATLKKKKTYREKLEDMYKNLY